MLDEAVVYRRAEDGELQIANVCIPDLEGPFVIRGKLDVDMSEQDQRSCCMFPISRCRLCSSE